MCGCYEPGPAPASQYQFPTNSPRTPNLGPAPNPAAGNFIVLAIYAEYFETPALFLSAINSLYISVIGTVAVLGTAFVYGYALTRTCMPFKWFFRLVAAIPLLKPSLLSGISLVYWFGRQGVAKELLFGESIYGPIGIVIGLSYWVFPHALMIVITALSIAGARILHALLTRGITQRTQAWRTR